MSASGRSGAHRRPAADVVGVLGLVFAMAALLIELFSPAPQTSGSAVPVPVPVRLHLSATLPRTDPAPSANYAPFGNNTGDDCVTAALANASLADAALAGVPLTISTQSVLRFYDAVRYRSGGTTPEAAFAYWRTHDFAGGQVVRYARLALSRPNIERAILTTGAVIASVRVPSSVLQLPRGRPWTILRVPSRFIAFAGGHEIALIGYTRAGFIAVTWGYPVLIPWHTWAVIKVNAWEFIPPVVVRAHGFPWISASRLVALLGLPPR